MPAAAYVKDQSDAVDQFVKNFRLRAMPLQALLGALSFCKKKSNMTATADNGSGMLLASLVLGNSFWEQFDADAIAGITVNMIHLK